MATKKTNGTRKTNTARKGATKERKELENRYPDNKIVDFGVENVRYFEDNFGNDSAFFDLNLGFMVVKGLLYRQNKDGEGYISFSSEKGKDGKYYKTGFFIDESLTNAIVEAVEDEIISFH